MSKWITPDLHCQWDSMLLPFLPLQPKPGPSFTGRYTTAMAYNLLNVTTAMIQTLTHMHTHSDTPSFICWDTNISETTLFNSRWHIHINIGETVYHCHTVEQPLFVYIVYWTGLPHNTFKVGGWASSFRVDMNMPMSMHLSVSIMTPSTAALRLPISASNWTPSEINRKLIPELQNSIN